MQSKFLYIIIIPWVQIHIEEIHSKYATYVCDKEFKKNWSKYWMNKFLCIWAWVEFKMTTQTIIYFLSNNIYISTLNIEFNEEFKHTNVYLDIVS